MKFILREGINPPSDGKMMTRPRPISMITLQASKSHSSTTPKSEPSTYETPHVHAPVTPTQSTGTSSVPPGFQIAKQSHLITNVTHQISELERLLTPFTIKLRCVSQLLRHNWMLFNRSWKKAFSYSCQKGGEQYKNEKECAYWKGELCAHIYLYLSLFFLFMVIVLCFG